MNRRDRGCLCKRRFETQEECEQSIREGGKPFGEIELRAYKCKFCKKWHKTKKAGRVNGLARMDTFTTKGVNENPYLPGDYAERLAASASRSQEGDK